MGPIAPTRLSLDRLPFLKLFKTEARSSSPDPIFYNKSQHGDIIGEMRTSRLCDVPAGHSSLILCDDSEENLVCTDVVYKNNHPNKRTIQSHPNLSPAPRGFTSLGTPIDSQWNVFVCVNKFEDKKQILHHIRTSGDISLQGKLSTAGSTSATVVNQHTMGKKKTQNCTARP